MTFITNISTIHHDFSSHRKIISNDMSEYSCLSSFWCWSEWFFGQRIPNVITMLSRKCMSPERLSSSFWTTRSIFFVSALIKCSIDEISSMDAFHFTDDDFECHTRQAVSRCVSYIVSLEKRFSLTRLLSLYGNYCVVSSKSYLFGKFRRKTITRIRELKCQQKKKKEIIFWAWTVTISVFYWTLSLFNPRTEYSRSHFRRI